MKKLNITFIVLFFALLLVPIATFRWRDGVVSEIDNRMLTDNPFKQELGLSETLKQLDSYAKDRIGLRNEMIRGYTQLNDRLFGELVHPTYIYGTDGYIFFKQSGGGPHMGEYHRQFAEAVLKMQTYCTERGVPFLFVFDPSKATVLTDKLAEGINYNNGWTDELFALLDEYGVHYIDNTQILKEKTAQGEAVFNQKYNAGHWNDLGAFYGINNVLSELKSDFPTVHINSKDEFEVTQKQNASLMVSEFPIDEYEPIFTAKKAFTDLTDTLCGEIAMDSQHSTFAYRTNSERMKEGNVRALVFQGSYFNGMGYKFLANSLGEYVAVHNYQNVLNMPYYFNLFKPDCVVFEVTEYTFSDNYFSYDKIKNLGLNRPLSVYDNLPQTEKSIEELSVSIENGQALTVISVNGFEENTESAYLIMNGEVYDFLPKTDGSFGLSVINSDYSDSMEIVSLDSDESTCTRYK